MRPKDITTDRATGLLKITWPDHHKTEYSLRWLRANCPCATCREERRKAIAQTDELTLTAEPPPSTQVAHAELVGNYAVRFEWTDGHATGIYTFDGLRTSCPCSECNPGGPPPFMPD